MVSLLRQVTLFIALCTLVSSAHAITPISGTITEDTVWTAEGGPYTVVGSIKVAPGVTLTIEGGAQVEGAEVKFLSNLMKSHQTHFDNTGKGPGITDCNVCHNAKFKDNQPLETTTVCNECHSPGGAYPGTNGLMDPVIGAKANFALGGVYETDGVTLKEGKEKWCSTCHDAEQSISNPVGLPATYAPNIVGDDTTYGYWQTGHGKSISNCLECHDASKKHFDHEHRTYEIDETTNTVVNNWGDSYRLRTKSAKSDENFCLTCHNQEQLRNTNEQSNFKAGAGTSGHNAHVWGIMNGLFADTDYDGVEDSRPICTTCHNTHGSKSNKMTRTGELASTPGTDDRTPGLNQTYVKPAPGPFSTATWTPNLPTSGTFEVFAWWKNNGSLEKAKYTINHDGGSSIVTVQQAGNGDAWNSLGTYAFSAGTSHSVVLSADYTIGKLLVADQIGFDTDGDGIPDIVIDDADAEFTSTDLLNGGEWPVVGWLNGHVLSNQERFTLDVSLGESTAGWVRFNPSNWINRTVAATNVCQNCHGAIVYERTPFMGPKIINRFETKRWVLNDGTGVADIVVSVIDPDYDMAGGSVTIDASVLGGSSAAAMTDNGDRTYSYQIAVPAGTADRSFEMPVTATDAAGNVGSAVAHVYVKSSADAIYLDNEDVTCTKPDNWVRNTLNTSTYNGSYVTSVNKLGDLDEEITATWEPSIEKAGTYNVYAWLYNFGFGNSNATYAITDANGTTAVPVDQSSGVVGGGWRLLGTFNYEAGATASITLSGTDLRLFEQLFVDAIKLEPVP